MEQYLFVCNKVRDIENNIDEVEIPEFTMEDVNKLDTYYKKHLFGIIVMNPDIECNGYDDILLEELHTQFELNELLNEHIDYMIKLREIAANYMNISKKHDKIRMYFNNIVPLLQKYRANLEEVIENGDNEY